MTTMLILPSLKVSGGIREALRLATEANAAGCSMKILSMWRSPHSMHTDIRIEELSDWTPNAVRALPQLVVLMLRFVHRVRGGFIEKPPSKFVFTHYATFPLSFFVPRSQRLFFVQDLEWRFVGHRLASIVLRRYIKAVYRTGSLISANAYLTQSLRKEGLDVACELPIWADSYFGVLGVEKRDIDFVMVLRKGAHKRLDLYLRFIELANEVHQRVAVITPEDDIAKMVISSVHHLAIRPSAAEIRDIYRRTRCFIHASDHEGFGLPPLEAMGSGCVPLCRNSGGVQAYMQDEAMADLLLPLSVPIDDVHRTATLLITDDATLQTYSNAARRVFATGVTLCSQARRGLMNVLC